MNNTEIYTITVKGEKIGMQLDEVQQAIYNQGFNDGVEEMLDECIKSTRKIFGLSEE